MEQGKEISIRVLDRALDVLECFTEDNRELNLIEITERTGLSTSTVHRLIKALEKREYLSRNEDTRRYSLGARIAQLGNLATNNSDHGLREIAYDYLIEMRDKINESSSLYVREGVSRICIERVESRQLLRRVITVGERLPLVSGATGKVLLSDLEESELKELLGDQFDQVMEEILKIRERGYWVTSGEREVGLSAIAAPVYNAKGRIIAAVSISGPTIRLIDGELAEKVRIVMDCGNRISQQLGYFK